MSLSQTILDCANVLSLGVGVTAGSQAGPLSPSLTTKDGALPVVGRGGQASFALLGAWGHLCVCDAVGWTTLVARGRPALPRCADGESGDKMIDRV